MVQTPEISEAALDEERQVLSRLRRELRAANDDWRPQAKSRLEAQEERYQTLLTLRVVAQEMHESQARGDLLGVISQTVINVIGCEDFAVFDSVGVGAASRFEVAMSMGIDPPQLQALEQALNRGQARLGQLARAGSMVVAGAGPTPLASIDPRLTACVPLCGATGVVGGLLMYQLLPQKRGQLTGRDHQILATIHEHSARLFPKLSV